MFKNYFIISPNILSSGNAISAMGTLVHAAIATISGTKSTESEESKGSQVNQKAASTVTDTTTTTTTTAHSPNITREGSENFTPPTTSDTVQQVELSSSSDPSSSKRENLESADFHQSEYNIANKQIRYIFELIIICFHVIKLIC